MLQRCVHQVYSLFCVCVGGGAVGNSSPTTDKMYLHILSKALMGQFSPELLKVLFIHHTNHFAVRRFVSLIRAVRMFVVF